MLIPESAIKLLTEAVPRHADCYVVFPIAVERKDEDLQKFLKQIKSLGYAAYLRTTEIGEEVVVTSEVRHGDAGPPRD